MTWIEMTASADAPDTSAADIAASVWTLLAGAALGVILQFLFDRWRHTASDYELWAECLSAPYVSHVAIPASPIEFSVSGASVTNPHITDIWVWAAGKRDVDRRMFDDSHVDVHLGVPIVGYFAPSPDGNIGATKAESMPNGIIRISPSLVRKRFAYHRRVVTDGVPRVTFTSEVPNLDTLSYLDELRDPPTWRRATRVVLLLIGGLGLLGFVTTFALAMLQHGSAHLTAVLFALTATAAIAGFGFPPLLDGAGRRANRARRVLRKSIPDAVAWEREDPFA